MVFISRPSFRLDQTIDMTQQVLLKWIPCLVEIKRGLAFEKPQINWEYGSLVISLLTIAERDILGWQRRKKVNQVKNVVIFIGIKVSDGVMSAGGVWSRSQN
jgi:hypothetical protein